MEKPEKREKGKRVIAELTVIPLGVGTGVSEYVKAALAELNKSGLKVQPTAMGTILEAGSLEKLFSAVGKAHEAVFKNGAERVVTMLRIDDRRDEGASIEAKLEAIR